ncbi:MAG TPA: hypothetical protein VJB12_05030 [Candidatus Nanoarchaeia archaeon]|nr:hypothetical protein [Candidatus Nanoarchaeia archaeon]
MALDMLALFLLPAIVILGIATSYGDLTHGKIKNKWIAYALLYSLAALVVAIIVLYLQGKPVSMIYVMRYAINLLFAALAGILLWRMGLWSAGDGKLFIAYAALIPLSLYSAASATYFPSFLILAYTFVPIMIFWLSRILLQSSTKAKIALLRKMAAPGFLLDTFLSIFAFMWLGTVIFSYLSVTFPVAVNPFTLLIFVLVAMMTLRDVLNVPYRRACIVISALAIVFNHGRIFSVQFLLQLVVVFALYLFLRHFILNLAFEVFSTSLYVEKLRPGMVVAENYAKKGWWCRKKRLPPLGFFPASWRKDPKEKLILSSGSKGLTAEEVKMVKRLHSQGRIREHTVRVYQTVPFSPFMFLGVMLTIIFQSGILSV